MNSDAVEKNQIRKKSYLVKPRSERIGKMKCEGFLTGSAEHETMYPKAYTQICSVGKKKGKVPTTLPYFRIKKEIRGFDDLVKSQKLRFPVLPAEAGIQFFQIRTTVLDSGFHRSDDFLRNHQI
jgi:hypothetical protein